MNALIYNISIVLGMGLVASGCWMMFGVPIALMVAGALVLTFSVIGVSIAQNRG